MVSSCTKRGEKGFRPRGSDKCFTGEGAKAKAKAKESNPKKLDNLNPTTEKFFGLSRNKKQALFIIALSMLIWLFRPFQECKWYEIGCHAGWVTMTPVFIIVAGVLLIVGVWRFVKND